MFFIPMSLQTQLGQGHIPMPMQTPLGQGHLPSPQQVLYMTKTSQGSDLFKKVLPCVGLVHLHGTCT